MSRALSQAISEGDGISLIVLVADAEAARAAAEQGAEGLATDEARPELGEATELPVLCRRAAPGEAHAAGADAVLLVVEHAADDDDRLAEFADEAHRLGLELVVDVRDDEELAFALDRLDPEIFLLSARDAEDDEEPVDRVLSLLSDVPAGKLAIADVEARTRDDVVALERAGFDGVLVRAGNVAELVGAG